MKKKCFLTNRVEEMGMIFKSCLQVFSLIGILFLMSETNIAICAFAQTTSESAQNLAKPVTGQEIFSENCEVCHTLGSSDVAPDLKGATTRRTEEWLRNFIRHPSQMIEKKDPIAMELLAKYKDPMPDVVLTDEDVAKLVEYLKTVSGVAVTVATETPKIIKKAASREDINKGMALFQGSQRFLRQGPSCMSCHDVRKTSFFAGGGLAKELTKSYSKLGESGINSILKNPPFPVMREAYESKELTQEEIVVLIDFLANIEKEQTPTDYRSKMLNLSIVGLGGLFILYFILWAAGNSRRIK